MSPHGTVEVVIPRDFNGLVRHRTIHGSFAPSDAIVTQSTTFSVVKGVGRTFIGDWTLLDFSGVTGGSQDGDNGAAMASAMERMTSEVSETDGTSVPSSGSDDWPADMLTIDSTHGKLNIRYNDE